MMKNTDQQDMKITDSFQFLPAISDDTAMESDPKDGNAKRTHTRTPGNSPPPKKGGSPMTTDPYEEAEKIWGLEQGSKSPGQNSEERAMDTRYEKDMEQAELALQEYEQDLKLADAGPVWGHEQGTDVLSPSVGGQPGPSDEKKLEAMTEASVKRWADGVDAQKALVDAEGGDDHLASKFTFLDPVTPAEEHLGAILGNQKKDGDENMKEVPKAPNEITEKQEPPKLPVYTCMIGKCRPKANMFYKGPCPDCMKLGKSVSEQGDQMIVLAVKKALVMNKHEQVMKKEHAGFGLCSKAGLTFKAVYEGDPTYTKGLMEHAQRAAAFGNESRLTDPQLLDYVKYAKDRQALNKQAVPIHHENSKDTGAGVAEWLQSSAGSETPGSEAAHFKLCGPDGNIVIRSDQKHWDAPLVKWVEVFFFNKYGIEIPQARIVIGATGKPLSIPNHNMTAPKAHNDLGRNEIDYMTYLSPTEIETIQAATKNESDGHDIQMEKNKYLVHNTYLVGTHFINEVGHIAKVTEVLEDNLTTEKEIDGETVTIGGYTKVYAEVVVSDPEELRLWSNCELGGCNPTIVFPAGSHRKNCDGCIQKLCDDGIPVCPQCNYVMKNSDLPSKKDLDKLQTYHTTLKDQVMASEEQLAQVLRETQTARASHAQPLGQPPYIFCCYFARRRKCKFGDNCHHLHEGNRRVRNLMNSGHTLMCDRESHRGTCRHKTEEHHP